jgi:hypothetical protein
MERPVFALQVRPEPGVPDVIRSLRAWLKQGLRAHGLRCVSLEELDMAKQRRIGVPAAEAADDIWLRRATAAAIAAVRQVIDGDAIPKATSVGRLTDQEIGWLVAAAIFAWIRTRAEQATAEEWDTERTLRITGQTPEPWDAGAVTHILPRLAELEGFDWERPIAGWSKDTVIRFLLEAMKLITTAMTARDLSGGGGITTNRKSLDEMQRIASAEAGGPLAAPGELDDPIPF